MSTLYLEGVSETFGSTALLPGGGSPHFTGRETGFRAPKGMVLWQWSGGCGVWLLAPPCGLVLDHLILPRGSHQLRLVECCLLVQLSLSWTLLSSPGPVPFLKSHPKVVCLPPVISFPDILFHYFCSCWGFIPSLATCSPPVSYSFIPRIPCSRAHQVSFHQNVTGTLLLTPGPAVAELCLVRGPSLTSRIVHSPNPLVCPSECPTSLPPTPAQEICENLSDLIIL